MSMKVTNTQKGPRGIKVLGGANVFVEPGETVEVEMTKAEVDSAKRTGWFELDGEPEGEKVKELDPDTAATARHLGAGKYGVFLGEDRMGEETYSKEAAMTKAAELNKDV